ncbi:MAG: hypothetical protein CMG13_07055 [Candidatus Marinimicrobia bacterium]|nr:hypothetical protein [Candidatus Neomarinimicrobiota bacterium]
MIKFILNNNNLNWLQICKIGIIFILIGLLILLFKEFIIIVLASIFILIGFAILYFAFKLWHQKNNSI